MSDPAHLPTLIIPAAGGGSRYGGDTPKQFLHLAGQPVLQHAIAPFRGLIGRLVVAAAADRCTQIRTMLSSADPGCPWLVVTGGADRQSSVAAALEQTGNAEIVLVHDAARPLLRRAAVLDLLAILRTADAAILAEPCTATVKRVDGERRIIATEDRSRLWLAQTPQGFRTIVGRQAFARAVAAGEQHTDEAAVLAAAGIAVQIVPGSSDNIKITAPGDLRLAEALLRFQSEERGAG